MRTYLSLLIVALLGWSLSGCQSTDLSLLNEVKRFEPEWMDLSEKVTTIKELFTETKVTYEAFFKYASPYLNDPDQNQRNGLATAKSRYTNLIEERDKLEKSFEDPQKRFEEAVREFNQWQNDLMQDNLKEDKAYEQFRAYQETFRGLNQEITAIEDKLLRNIEQSNSLVRTITRSYDDLWGNEYLIDVTY